MTAAALAASRARSTRFWLTATMAVWGVNLSAVKLLTASFGLLQLSVLRMGVACVVLSALAWWRSSPSALPTPRQAAAAFACGALMVYANQVFFTAGLQRTTATHGALIMALSPLVSTLLAAVFFRERLGATRLLGIALGFGGVAAVVLHRPAGGAIGANAVGDALMLASVVAFAAGGLGVQRLSRGMDALTIGWAVHCSGAALLLAHALLAGVAIAAPGRGLDAWALVVFSGAISTALASVVWNRAIATLGVARTAMSLYWIPVFGVGFAALFIGEPITGWHVGGLAAVAGGTWLGKRSRAGD